MTATTAPAVLAQPESAIKGQVTLRYEPGLDGLRGLGVIVMLTFHGGFLWLKGAIFAMTMFFCLSGYLITSLLLVEAGKSGHIDLKAFWIRRLRRLGPAMVVTLGLVAVYGALIATASQRATLRGDIWASLGWAANWRFIATDQSYAHLFQSPSPVLHFWSLAVEEQFYLFFPMIVAGVFAVTNGSRRALAVVLSSLAAVSLFLTLFVFTNHDRIYYGTDTRALEFIAGGLLAIAVVGRRRPRSARLPTMFLGFVAAAITVWAWFSVGQFNQWTYEGGFAVLALVSVVLVRAVTLPGPLRSFTSLAPLRYVGRISYGLYLYHWPVFLWLDESRTGLSLVPLFALRMAVTATIAIFSYRYIELPIRTGRRLPSWRILPGFVAAAVAVAVLVPVLVQRPAADALVTQSTFDRVSNRLKSRAAHARRSAAAPRSAVGGVPTPMRILVVGDSIGELFAGGLSDWGVATGKATVFNDAQALCGYFDVRLFRWGTEPGLPMPTYCAGWEARWQRLATTDKPDAVVMIGAGISTMNAVLPTSPDWVHLGDAAFDDFIYAHMQQASAIFTAQNIPVLWFDSPALHRPPDASGQPVDSSDPARIVRFNALVDRLTKTNPLIRRVTWKNYFNSLSADADAVARPDGVHVLPVTVVKLLNSWLWPEMTSAYQQAERAKPAPSSP